MKQGDGAVLLISSGVGVWREVDELPKHGWAKILLDGQRSSLDTRVTPPKLHGRNMDVTIERGEGVDALMWRLLPQPRAMGTERCGRSKALMVQNQEVKHNLRNMSKWP
jgi:hypothetical protein